MKKVLAWVKGHLLIVICSALMVILLPAGFVVSGILNKSVRTKAGAAFSESKRKIDGVAKVTYALPAVFEGEPAVEESRAPNEAVTRFFAERREARQIQVAQVVERAVEANRRGYRPLIDGLLPKAESERERLRKLRELARALIGDEQTRGAYQRMLEKINAGSPVDSGELASTLSEWATDEQQRRAANAGEDKISESQQEALTEELTQRRLAALAQRASEISVYADASAILGPAEPGASQIPEVIPEAASEADTFVWQWDAWVIESVLDAVAAANTDAIGSPTGVPESVVKRVERVSVEAPVLSAPTDGSEFGGGQPARGGVAGGGAGGPGDVGGLPWSPTHTKRASVPDDDAEVRMVRLTAVVAPERLPRFIDALARTNFMTVTGVRLSPVDPGAELAAGYFFGAEHVARAEILIETVWLRAWLKEFMPAPVRAGLGIPEDAPAEDGSGGSGDGSGGGSAEG